jgi:hypothetical protein
MEKEEWKDIPEYEGMYQVSNLGRVKSLPREMKNRGKYNFISKEKILKPHIDGAGYKFVVFYRDNKTKTKRIHQLVAITFLNHKPNGHKLVVDHINDIKIDNRLLNLQIVTGRFNSYKTQGKGTSMYKGVCWNSKLKKWQSQIRINDKNKVIGYYINELEASEAYQLKLKTL